MTHQVLYCRLIRQAGQRIVFFLKPAQVSFHLRRYAGIPFRNDFRNSSGGVYPVASANSLLIAPGCSAFPAGFLLSQVLFQQKVVVYETEFYQAYCTTTGIERFTAWRTISIVSCAGVRNTLPSQADGHAPSGLVHCRETTAVRPESRCGPGK